MWNLKHPSSGGFLPFEDLVKIVHEYVCKAYDVKSTSNLFPLLSRIHYV